MVETTLKLAIRRWCIRLKPFSCGIRWNDFFFCGMCTQSPMVVYLSVCGWSPWSCAHPRQERWHQTGRPGWRSKDGDTNPQQPTPKHKSIAVKTARSYKLRLSYSNSPPPWIVVQSVCNVVPETFCQVFHEFCSLQRQEFKYRKPAVTSNYDKYTMYKLHL